MLQLENIVDSNFSILETYVPEEILISILSYVDCSQLILCHLVCKRWNELIKRNVWRKKAEVVCGQKLIFYDKIHWSKYFFICKRIPFERNILISKNVKVFYNPDKFKAVKLDILPLTEGLFKKDIKNCIQIVHEGYVSVTRKFVIDLIKEGFTEYILDNVQPVIEVSAWYGTTINKNKTSNVEYNCSIKLLNGNEFVVDHCNRVMRVYHFNKMMTIANKQGKWFKFTHVLKNYGPGLRLIKFYDGGHNNIVIAGASIIMKVPSR